ncbi:hypothetical protein BCR32DRAFT_246997 [Anaeromyces robustus]|uniref:Inhibitor I9 domain-containing protein n=1 Tax=Anaeromyces robustus TaxID=1754192 RepID=A0A1Y1WZL4_9FUNG|nr:hypothetical protein BCR32DRAFT_246997 [Anaeromyces robustus]|eukprot:ORX78626.1 hypothetical protein BCR32DRAFT_246997 [Anaeromyces robustus]
MKMKSFYCCIVLIIIFISLVSAAGEEYYLVLADKNEAESVHDEIYKLILENKNTFKDQQKFEKVEKDFQSKKDTFALDYGNTGYVYQITTTKDSAILVAYLNPELIPKVEKLPNVIGIEENKTDTIDDDYYVPTKTQMNTNTVNIPTTKMSVTNETPTSSVPISSPVISATSIAVNNNNNNNNNNTSGSISKYIMTKNSYFIVISLILYLFI